MAKKVRRNPDQRESKIKRNWALSTLSGNLWIDLLLLLIAVAVPVSCVLWFMSEAVRNERLAVQQKLRDTYRIQLVSISKRLDTYWKYKKDNLDVTTHFSPPAAFAHLVRTGMADSVVIFDSTGKAVYPEDTLTLGIPMASSVFLAAWKSEFTESDYSKAAREYEEIGRRVQDINFKARALAAQARCYFKADNKSLAIRILTGALADSTLRSAIDESGNLIYPSTRLRVLQILDDKNDTRWNEIHNGLVDYVNDYSDPLLSSHQRVFLMEQLLELNGTGTDAGFNTLEAERLARDYLDSNHNSAPTIGFQPTPVEGIWSLFSTDSSVVALLTLERIRSESMDLIELEFPFEDLDIDLVSHEPLTTTHLLSQPAGFRFPGWHLTLQQKGSDTFDTAAKRQISFYLGIGIVGIAFITVLAFLVGRYLRNQVRLTRLRNDLIATVSHELKTPLASMRVLVDTLIEDRISHPGQTKEYLALISKENSRLSRLIDNFLTFSRLERKRGATYTNELEVGNLVKAAVEAVCDRYEQPGSNLITEISDNLPKLTGDFGALTSVLTNLLENAHKYSGDEKKVVLRAFADNDALIFEVEDNGIGLSKRASKKIFDRFYQVDRSLSRSSDGCGLGLSIVEFIVKAHRGTVSVASELGRGSTFTVRLPAK